MYVLKALLFAILVLATGLANAQGNECGLAFAPACGGTCSDGFLCVPATGGGLPGVPAGCECEPGVPLGGGKLAIQLQFSKALKDSLVLQDLLSIPAGFDVGGQTLVVDVGGVVQSFVLDKRGKSRIGDASAVLRVKSKKGVVPAQNAKLQVKISKASLAANLADEGLTNVSVVNAPVSVAVGVTADGTLYRRVAALSYSAKQGKTGKAK